MTTIDDVYVMCDVMKGNHCTLPREMTGIELGYIATCQMNSMYVIDVATCQTVVILLILLVQCLTN